HCYRRPRLRSDGLEEPARAIRYLVRLVRGARADALMRVGVPVAARPELLEELALHPGGPFGPHSLPRQARHLAHQAIARTRVPPRSERDPAEGHALPLRADDPRQHSGPPR